MINSTPIDVLFRSPPDIVLCSTLPIWVSAISLEIPKFLSNNLTQASYSSFLIWCSFKRAAKVRASFGVKKENK